jgi:hypothetical protein
MHQWAEQGNSELHKNAFAIETRMRRVGNTEKPALRERLRPASRKSFNGDEVLRARGLSKVLWRQDVIQLA